MDEERQEHLFLPEFMSNALDKYSDQLMIPQFLHTMARLNCVTEKSQLAAIDSDHMDELMKDDRKLVSTLWQQADGLEYGYRRSFAIVLMAALKRCLGSGFARLESADSLLDSKSLLSKEAMLLQASKAPETTPLQEMRACIASEIP